MDSNTYIKKLEADVEHYKLYYKSWQKARRLIDGLREDKSYSKEEKTAIKDIYNMMTVAISDEVKPIK